MICLIESGSMFLGCIIFSKHEDEHALALVVYWYDLCHIQESSTDATAASIMVKNPQPPAGYWTALPRTSSGECKYLRCALVWWWSGINLLFTGTTTSAVTTLAPPTTKLRNTKFVARLTNEDYGRFLTKPTVRSPARPRGKSQMYLFVKQLHMWRLGSFMLHLRNWQSYLIVLSRTQLFALMHGCSRVPAFHCIVHVWLRFWIIAIAFGHRSNILCYLIATLTLYILLSACELWTLWHLHH